MKVSKIIFAIFCVSASAEINALAGTCENLENLEMKNTIIVSAQIIPAGMFTPPLKRQLQRQQSTKDPAARRKLRILYAQSDNGCHLIFITECNIFEQ